MLVHNPNAADWTAGLPGREKTAPPTGCTEMPAAVANSAQPSAIGDHPESQVVLMPILRRFAGADAGGASGTGAAAFRPKPIAFASCDRVAA